MKDLQDFWCEPGALAVSIQEHTLVVSGKMRYCLLGSDGDGAPAYHEVVSDVSQEYPLNRKADRYLGNLSVEVNNCRYEVRDSTQLICYCQLKIDGVILGVMPITGITGIKVDESREKKRESQSAMTIYYADAGENIWSIAKRYNTSIAAVMEENGLEEEVLLEKRIVLIPMVG